MAQPWNRELSWSLLIGCSPCWLKGDELSHNGPSFMQNLFLHRANICSCKLPSSSIFLLIVLNLVADCCCLLQVLFFRLYVIDLNLLILTTSATQCFVSQSAEVFPESAADKFEHESSSLLSWCEEFGLSIRLLPFVTKTIFCQFRSISHLYSHILADLMDPDGGKSTSSMSGYGRTSSAGPTDLVCWDHYWRIWQRDRISQAFDCKRRVKPTDRQIGYWPTRRGQIVLTTKHNGGICCG